MNASIRPSHKPGRTLITGASSGIGAEFARTFARHGHSLILVARRADKLEALAQGLRQQYGIAVEVIPQDLGQAGAAEQLHREVTQRGLAVDILVNNAGLLFRGTFPETRLAEQQALLQLNITVLTELTHLFLPAMVERGHGRVLNLASSAAFQPLPWTATYAASKAYVLSFSEALSIELKHRGVSVTALCPGFTETDMIAQQGAKTFKIPGVRNLTPAKVAEQGYAACMAGTPVYINGAVNRALVLMGQHLPRWLQRLSAEWFARAAMR
ncbi:SDR family oxidoreductase [Solimonas sp. K1W22B-7]|uniref:SDR family NAD(P)-dependent oxidoreductase n=1 Tax=Solimonas sp. K1W22B-7 TaxID=2303331 RepID=UPI000E3361D8|nr:SDR family oxidoreductase [Solimonas sp. K1W22B-7]AXQ28520.1 SDR family oxidoreductase [Solimonas sp. K1W22B-7]